MISTDMFIGSMIGEYQIKRLLGQSPLGVAYLALHPAQGRKAIVIIFHLPEGMSAQEREQLGLRVAREGEMLTRLAHPHILPIYACGMQPGYLYLVTALVEEASLSQSLKQYTRFTPQQTLSMLKQLAAGLDYAHSQGVVHGMLSLSNVIVSSEFDVRIAGFGLLTMLDIYGNAQNARPLTHLTSKSGTFLGRPEYIAPERVMGLPVEARSDIYALGVMLFELLSGVQPFRGAQPLDIALQHLQQPIPSVHAVCPEVPEMFDLVLRNMLERDPAKRTQQAGEATSVFERVVKALDPWQWATPTSVEQSMRNAQVTIPPTVNWFDEPMTQWQVPAVSTRQLPNTTTLSDEAQTIVQTSPKVSFAQPGSSAQAGNNPNSLGGADPFAWWAGTSNGLRAASPIPGKVSQHPPVRSNNAPSRSRSRPARLDRRKLISLLGTGMAASILTVSGISLARIMQSTKQSQTQTANGPSSGSTTTTGNNTPTAGATSGAQNTTPTAQASATRTPQAGATTKPTQGQQPTPTQGQQPTPTPKPQPTPTQPPSHTGTVIGHTNQAANSAVSFTNPADGKQSWLVHLANGNWAACEVACTHVGVTVNYDSGSQQMVCPAHGAIFNPANGFAYQPGSGPGTFAPLPKVTVRVNGDGTITTG